MGKFNNGLVKETKQTINNEKKQSQLREKYHLEKNIQVVEKNNLLKFLINLLIMAVKTIATIIICFFAVIGVFSIIYPSTNAILKNVLSELMSYFFK
ncbi:MAG: hypothetical protein K2H01_05445 [Ruminococcus sp.]|nr:hypothetical protein [Ruminococcus sp.]